MKLKRDNINFDYSIKQYRTRISIDIAEYNPMMAKAKAELVASIIDAIFPIIEAKQAEFEEIYGEEVIKNAHHVPIEKTEIPITTTKYIHSQEVRQNLLDKAFQPKEDKDNETNT